MDPFSAPSLEGYISRAASIGFALLFLSECFFFAVQFVDRSRKSALSDRIEGAFVEVGRQWQTLMLLVLAFSIATFVPIAEKAALEHDIISSICKEIDPQQDSAACKRALRDASQSHILDQLAGNKIDAFQMGLWLFGLFVIGLFAEFFISRAKPSEVQHRVLAALLGTSCLLYVIGWMQDYLGR